MVAPQLDANLGDSILQHMRRDFSRLRLDQTVGEALAWLRDHPPEGRIIYFYVLDAEDRLQGVIPTRRLLLSRLETPVSEIMIKRVIAIPDGATVLDACGFFTIHRLLAFPVVDRDRRLLGVVDVELYTEELSELDASDRKGELFQVVGVYLTEAQQASPMVSFRIRFPWLLCNIAGGMLAAFLIGLFQAEVRKTVALAFFIPVLLTVVESVGLQSVSLALQALRGRQPTWGTLGRKLHQEVLIGVALGVGSGVLAAVAVLAWLGQWPVALCVLGGVTAGGAIAAAVGLALPNVLRMLRRDPQVAAGPIAVASANMMSLLVYFALAHWLLG